MSSPQDPKHWFKRLMDMNAGLTKVSTNVSIPKTSLPERSIVRQGGSPDAKIDNQLVRVLDVKTIGSDIVKNLDPKYYNSSFIPEEYKRNLTSIVSCLREEQFNITDPNIKKIYKDAEDLISKEDLNNDLLDEFRVMLLQG